MKTVFFKATGMDGKGRDGWPDSAVDYAESLGTGEGIGLKRNICVSLTPEGSVIGTGFPCRIFQILGEPSYPLSEYRLDGTRMFPEDKHRFCLSAFSVVGEVPQEHMDRFLGIRYSELIELFDPLQVSTEHWEGEGVAAIEKWAKTWGTLFEAPMLHSVEFTYRPVIDRVRKCAWTTMGHVPSRWRRWKRYYLFQSIWSCGVAYLASLYPDPPEWSKSGALLWKNGLVPSYDGTSWRLHYGVNAQITWKGEIYAISLPHWCRI